MHRVEQGLRRQFWGLYGRFVWDAHNARLSTPLVGRVVEVFLARAAKSGERLLDAGCGTGNYALALAHAGFAVVAADYAAGMLARARAKAARLPGRQPDFRQLSLAAPLPFPDGYFGHALSVSVLQALADPGFTLGELRRVLRPGGGLLLVHYGHSPYHALSLRDELAARRRATELPVGMLGLVLLKSWAERRGAARTWEAPALDELLRTSGYLVRTIDAGPPIVVLAERPV